MKKIELQPRQFRELTGEEQYTCNGGGFAFDVGRFLRFIYIAGPKGLNTPVAVADFVANKY